MMLLDQIPQYIASGLTVGSIYALAAIGFNLIYNGTSIINFAQGEFIMLGGLFMVTFHVFLGVPLIPAFALTVIIVAFVGCLVERLAIHPAYNSPVLNLIIITIGVSIVLKGGAMLSWGTDAVFYAPFSKGAALRLGNVSIAPQAVWVLGITVLVALLLRLFFGRTLLGIAIRGCAENKDAARSLGINVERMVLLSFAISSALGAIGGIIITPITTMSFSGGTLLGLKGFCALIVGGLGSNLGALVGGLILGVSESLAVGFISSALKDAIGFLMLIVVLLIRPTGIFGVRR